MVVQDRTKKAPQAFVRDNYRKALKKIHEVIVSNDLSAEYFNDEKIILAILESISGDLTKLYLKSPEKFKEKIRNKKRFISIYGKLILEILDRNKKTQQKDIEEKFHVGSAPIKSIIRFLSYNDKKFIPELRFKKINIFKETFHGLNFTDFLTIIFQQLNNKFDKETSISIVFNKFRNQIEKKKLLYLGKISRFYTTLMNELIISNNNPEIIIKMYKKSNLRLEPLIDVKSFLDTKLGLFEKYPIGKHNRIQKRVKVNQEILETISNKITSKYDISKYYLGKLIGTMIYDNLNGNTLPSQSYELLKFLYKKEIPHNIHGRILRVKKWAFLYYDKFGKLLTDKESAIVAAHYLVKIILKGNTKIYTQEYVKNDKKRGDFISAIYHRCLTYNDILIEAGLTPNIDFKKWYDFYYDIDGNRLTYQESLNKFSSFLLKLISKNRSKWILEENEAPTYEILQKSRSGFLNAISAIGIRYNEVILQAGLKVNHPYGIYSSLFKDTYENPLNHDDALKVATQYFKKEILTDQFLLKHNLRKNEPPPYSILENDYSGFLFAIQSYNLPFVEILKRAGFQPFQSDKKRKIGRSSHWLLEAFFIIQMQKQNIPSFYEIYPNKKTANKILYLKFGKYHCDNTILNLEEENDNFKNLSTWLKNLSESIEMINIDYFLGISMKRIARKCLKGYQGKHKLLILLSIHGTKKNIPHVPYFIPYRKNVIIVDPYTFAKIFGFKGETYERFIKLIRLIKGAIYDKNKMLKLFEISKKAKEYLLKNPKFSQVGLEKYLNSNKILRMDLLEYTP